jgi:hypothetical protein
MKKIGLRHVVLVFCFAVLIIAFSLHFFPSPLKQIEEKEAEIRQAIVSGNSEDVDFVLAKEEGTGDYYAVPGEWVKTRNSLYFTVKGKPIKIDP